MKNVKNSKKNEKCKNLLKWNLEGLQAAEKNPDAEFEERSTGSIDLAAQIYQFVDWIFDS